MYMCAYIYIYNILYIYKKYIHILKYIYIHAASIVPEDS